MQQELHVRFMFGRMALLTHLSARRPMHTKSPETTIEYGTIANKNSIAKEVSIAKEDGIAKEDAIQPKRVVRPRISNRVHVVMIHASRYSFQGRARLASDVGVSRSTISRLINGQTSPSHSLVQSITDVLSLHLKRPLEPRDLFSADGRYPQPSGCLQSGCRGCLPETAFDGHGRRRTEWQNARPGDWSLAPEP